MTHDPTPETNNRFAQMTQTAPAPETDPLRAQAIQHRATYGEDRVKLLSVPTGPGQRLRVVVRAPTRDEYDRYLETLVKLEKKTAQALGANRTLLMACLLAPDAPTVAAELDRRPSLVDKLIEPVLNMAGADAEVREELF